MKTKYMHISLIFIFSLLFTGCVNKIAQPTIDNYNDKVKILEEVKGYYKSRIGKEKKLLLNFNQYNSKHTLMKWTKNSYKTICFTNKICLVDTLENGYFTHSAISGREELFQLDKPVKYSILKKISHIEYIDDPEIYHNKEIDEGLKIIYIPVLNTISHKEIGESIYQKINQLGFNTYTVRTNHEMSVHPADEYGEKKYKLHSKFDKKYSLMKWAKEDYKTICQDQLCLIDVNNNNTFSHYAVRNEDKLYPLNKLIKYEAIQKIKYNEDSFKYQALYQGKIGNRVKISFREFKNDMARPAFTQDIEYQLKSNKPTIIGFKGLRIKIIKATNLNITYSVIKDYN